MKKFFIISLMALIVGVLNAQYILQESIAADTTKGAQTKYWTYTSKVPFTGSVSFDFTLKGFAASDDIVMTLQGSNESAFTKTFDIDTVTYSNNTVSNYIMFDETGKYLYYRIKEVGATGDTVRVYNKRFMVKRP